MKIELKQVSKTYGEQENILTILSSVDVTFESGKSHAVRGPSGIGKSTLLHLLAGLDSVSSGEILVGEQKISRMTEEQSSLFRRKHIGMIFQFHHLLPEFSAVENVMMPLLINGVSEGEAKERAMILLKRIGVAERSEHRPTQLSGGEQQRVAIARAVIAQPDLLFADEPTGNLDPENAEGISELLLELANEMGGTLIVVTHSPLLASKMDNEFEMSSGGALLLKKGTEPPQIAQ